MLHQNIAREAALDAPLPNPALLAQTDIHRTNPSTAFRLETPAVACVATLQFLAPAKVANRQPCMGKRFQCHDDLFIEKESYDRTAKWFRPLPEVNVASPTELLQSLKKYSAIGAILILGELNTDDPRVIELASSGLVTRTKREKLKANGTLQLPVWREVPRRAFMIDLDGSPEAFSELRRQGVDLFKDPVDAVRRTLDLLLPPDITEATVVYSFSAKAGLDTGGRLDGAVAKLHVFCILETALLPADFKSFIDQHNETLRACGYGKGVLDLALYQAVQPHFIASPEFIGGPDPIPERWGMLPGKHELVRLAVRLEEAIGASGSDAVEKSQHRRLVGRRADISLAKSSRHRPQGTYEECLIKVAEKGIHGNVLMATYRAAERLFDTHVISVGTPQRAIEEALAPYVVEIEAAVRKHRRDLPRTEMEKEIERLMEYALGAVARISFHRSSRVGIPSYSDATVSLTEAAPLIEAAVATFNREAREFHAASILEARAYNKWAAEDHGQLCPTSLVGPIRSAKPPHALLATEVGSGKTTIALRRIVQDFDLSASRVYFFVPTHDLAEQLARAFAETLKTLAAEGLDVSVVPPSRLFRGRTRPGQCEAPPSHKSAAERAAAEGVCVKAAVCKVCPAKGADADSGCKWFWQDDISPGLKIAVTASLGSNSIPGFPRTQKERDSQRENNAASIVAVFVDEGFGDALEEKHSISLASLLTTADISSLLSAAQTADQPRVGGSPYSGARGLLNDIIPLVGRSIKNASPHGELALSVFEPARLNGRLEHCCDLIARLLYTHADVAAKSINNALMTECSTEIGAERFAAQRKLRFLYELLMLVRLTPPGRPFLQCVSIHGEGKDRRLTLQFRKVVPDWLAQYPLMLLDATADDNSTLAFSVRDDEGNYSEPRIEVTRVKVRPENSFRLKVINAPDSKTKICQPISTARRRRGKKKTLTKKPPRCRLRRDATVETLARVASAICGRTTRAGLITNKQAAVYLSQHKALPRSVSSNWFGNIRGLNTFESSDVLFVVGRQLPALSDCESGAAATYAFDPNARAIEKGRRLERVTKYARVRLDSGDVGVAVDTFAHPCKRVDAFVRQRVSGEDIQARGRARAIRRTSDNPVLEISINNLVDDTAYDAVLDWRLLATIDERAAALHAYGVVPLAAAELFKLAPHLFAGQSQCRQVVKKSVAAPAPLLASSAREPTSSRAWTHPLLLPAEPRLATVVMRYRNRHTKKSGVWLDARRPDAGAAALANALGMKLERWKWLEQ